MQDSPTWHIASYPRSGNHLVRAIMEAYTHRPTEGCLGSTADEPIFQRSPEGARLIRIKSPRPIGYKAHFLKEIHHRDRSEPAPRGMILITRDPVAAISSHMARIVSDRRRFPWFTARHRADIVDREIDNYLALLFRYLAHDGPRFHLRFEDLMSPENAEHVVRDFLAELGTTLKPDPPLPEVFALAKESQQSLKRHNQQRKRQIEEAIRQRLTYPEVLAHLG